MTLFYLLDTLFTLDYKLGYFCIIVFRNRKCNIVEITYLNL